MVNERIIIWGVISDGLIVGLCEALQPEEAHVIFVLLSFSGF